MGSRRTNLSRKLLDEFDDGFGLGASRTFLSANLLGELGSELWWASAFLLRNRR